MNKANLFNRWVLVFRWTNLILMNFGVLLLIPYFVLRVLFFLGNKELYLSKADFFISDLAHLGVLLLIFAASWVFVIFLIGEIVYALRFKINFFSHIVRNKLVLMGIIPFFLYLILFGIFRLIV
jgi:hypothetical protein